MEEKIVNLLKDRKNLAFAAIFVGISFLSLGILAIETQSFPKVGAGLIVAGSSLLYLFLLILVFLI